jgi:hydroxymethylpyrimidine/phosphomethylpyrimidine kinase
MPRLLIIAGSDSGGGAGIQADIKTASAFGVYAATAITALTAQNTKGVFGVHEVPPAFVRQQVELVLADIGADAIKTGMLQNSAVIEAVATVLREKAQGIPLVVDPVMLAKGGAPLLASDAISSLKKKLLPLAALVTPNLPEAQALSGLTITTPADMEKAGKAILAWGPGAVLIKGGHGKGTEITDMLVTPEGVRAYQSPRLESTSTHGTGCTLASAIASGLATSAPLEEAIETARQYVLSAIRLAPGLGRGHGPLNHRPDLARPEGVKRRKKGA